ncbi:hypothetical protein GE061_012672 [Apolygus lucorum]|uniref:Uncharacterized protein n=1 Tax=Apolygus lucorum TaxID=248454 RepID=A0A6A4JXV9_APOLU|nr:hypothetical protein GE061_012672 [Apolygus lucorum]
MNSQFWVGCPTYWKDPDYNKLDVEVIKEDLLQMIYTGVGFNLYMFHGGTNFGLTSGLKTEGKYYLTSHDFDAPISESGDITPKYLEIQKLLGDVFGSDEEEKPEEVTNEENSQMSEDVEAPQAPGKGEYGKVLLTPVEALLDSQMACCRKSCISLFPKSMEEMNVRDGLMAYTTVLKDGAEKDAELKGTVRDRAYVILNNTDTIGIMENEDVLKLPKPVEEKSTLTFLVENQGRRPYKSGRSLTKGLFNMYLNGNLLDNWVISVFPFTGPKLIMKLQNNLRKKVRRAGRSKAEDTPMMKDGSENTPKKVDAIVPPALYIGTFTLPQESEEDDANKDKTHELDLESEISYEDLGDTFKDSYLDMTGWKKGIVFLNEFCLGRYWNVGPQRALFVPGSALLPYPWKNKITFLELEAAPKSLTTRFITTPEPEVVDVMDESVPIGGEATVKPDEGTAKPDEATAKPEEATAKPEDATAKPKDATAKPGDVEGGAPEGGKSPKETEAEKKLSREEATTEKPAENEVEKKEET